MTDVLNLLTNPAFKGMNITQAVEHCIQQDPAVPGRFIIRRAQLQDDEQLVRESAENPDIKEGQWRMYKAGLLNCTCKAIAMHFPKFADLRGVVKDKMKQLTASCS